MSPSVHSRNWSALVLFLCYLLVLSNGTIENYIGECPLRHFLRNECCHCGHTEIGVIDGDDNFIYGRFCYSSARELAARSEILEATPLLVKQRPFSIALERID